MWYKFNKITRDIEECDPIESVSRILFRYVDDSSDTTVSTVFLGLDHDHIKNKDKNNVKDHKPLVFETMVFSSDTAVNELTYRSRTYDQARLIHKTVVRGLKKRYANK